MRPVDPTSVHPARRWGLAVALGASALALGACSHDGRTMREANPDQNLSIITTTTSTTTSVPDAVEPGGLGSLDVETTPSTASSTTAAPVATDSVDSGPIAGFRVSAPWPDEGEIDARYTCAGDGAAPTLAWADVPPDAAELAVVVVDPDAENYLHWVIAGVTPGVTSIADGQLPPGAVEGTNGAGTVGWAPVCPPAGETHTYRVEVHALSAPSGAVAGADGQELLQVIDRSSLEQATVRGVFTGV